MVDAGTTQFGSLRGASMASRGKAISEAMLLLRGMRAWFFKLRRRLPRWVRDAGKLVDALAVGADLLPYSPRAAVRLYHITAHLLVAASEEDMLAGIGMLSQDATVRWFNVTLDAAGQISSAVAVGSRK